MEMPPGPPSLGESAPPPAPERYVDAEVANVDAGPSLEQRRADEAANQRMVATTAALAMIAVAVMIVAFLLTEDRTPDEPEPAPDVPAAAAVPTATTVAAAPDIDQAELDQVIDRVRSFVAEERGLEFESDVDVVVVSRDEYEDMARDSFDATLPDIGGYLTQHAAVYQAIGLWAASDDPVAINRELAAVGSLGYYDAKTHQVVMGVSELTPLFETTLAHELTHALDDQHFGLDRPELYQHSDERAAAFNALAEGDARRVESAYQATLTAEELGTINADAAAATPDYDSSTVPQILLIEQQVAYNDGQDFVQALLNDDGNDAVDAAFDDPPTTSEELQEPDTYLAGDEPTRVPIPEADEEAVAEGVVGQAILDFIASVDRPDGVTVPEWDGDRYVLWNDADQETTCIRFQVDGDAAGFEEQLAGWASQVDAEVSVVDDALVATSCR